jgi:hypothetical protein
MAFGAIAAAVSIGATIASTAGAIASASARNAAIRRSMQAQARAAQTQRRQLSEQAGIEIQKEERRAQQIQGRLRVASGEAGVGIGGSYSLLQQQAAFDQGRNVDIVNQNLQNQADLVSTGAQANLASMSSNYQSPILSGFTGALSGLSTGLSIGGAVNSFDRLGNTPEPEPFNPNIRRRLV